jgi:S-(hydroxymethyl)glutathione dehydrogenase/alcohol dehydrogenase
MRAAVLSEIPGRLEIVDVEHDEPGPHEAVVKLAASGLCHSDLHILRAHYPAPLPIVLGHESAGIVERVGSDVREVSVGDHVVTCLSMFCGNCEYCLAGRPALCSGKATMGRSVDDPPRLTLDGKICHQVGSLGTFAESILVHERSLARIPDEMPLEIAALLGCAVTTGLGAVFHTARVEAGSTVAVVGCGGVGLNVIQGALIAGASRIIAIDINDEKLEFARALGATDAVNASATDPVDQVRGLLKASSGDFSANGVDYAFEALGRSGTIEQAFRMTKKGGAATVIGIPPAGENIQIPAGELVVFEKKLQGSTMGSNRFRQDLPRYVELYLRGRLKIDEMVSAKLTPEEINFGFDAMERGEVARSLVMF